MTAITTAHCTLITQANIGEAFRIARRLPTIPCPPALDQVVLEALLAARAA